MNNIKERLKAIARYKELSVTKFEGETGLSNGLVGKVKKPNIETILKVVNRFPEINLQWLLTGDGDMVGEAKKNMPEEKEIQNKRQGIPLLDGEHIAAGLPSGKAEPLQDIDYINFPGIKNKIGDLAVKAKGRSMVDTEHPERSIPDGAIVVLSTRHGSYIEWGETFCIATRDGYTIKRLQPGHDENYVKCVSNNEKEGFIPFEIPTKDIITIKRVTAVITIKTL